MQTYPYTTPEGIIELVRKDEHDKALELLREIRDDQVNAQDEADKFLRDHQPSELSKLRVELTRWQSLAESLATALESSAKLYENPEPPSMHELAMRAYDMRCIARMALAAYESAKSGNIPDPLAEAVKRMEEVNISELSKPYEHAADFHSSDAGLRAVRARLISAAKGEQP